MSAHAERPQWQTMSKSDFDARLASTWTLDIPTGPVRIAAAPDASGTPALFGEAAPPVHTDRTRLREPKDAQGQEPLF
ncbi:hypothetical protein [Streptomyces sp. NPDC017529]|uniref:hypothetical protein n=1 Tax=Streptomyces sp. NPDC017529 TaxID=3365000 RepID=UPI0037953D5B